MSTTVMTISPATRVDSVAHKALNLAAQFWFQIAVIGQWIFLYYVAAFYGGAAVRGNLKEWNRVLSNGYQPGHTMSNIAVAAHLGLAVLIMFGGPLMLISQVRAKFPYLHRWTGRFYIPAVILTSIAGLYMVWSHPTPRLFVQHVGVSVDAILITTFAILALRTAVARDFQAHRRWTLRLFMVVNAGWFFRVGLMFWIAINRGPAGFDPDTFTGPFLNFWAFADYLLPLAVLELYLLAKARGSAPGRLAVAATIFIFTLAMGVGIAVATIGMWLPHM